MSKEIDPKLLENQDSIELIFYPEAGARFPGIVGQTIVLGVVIASLIIWGTQNKQSIKDELEEVQNKHHQKFMYVTGIGLVLVFISNILMNDERYRLHNWEKNNIFQKLRKNSKGKEKFVLHDGPPYANGHIHMGTALNKILKDIITRFHQMNGKDSVYVPGWDCHGLPIEWKIEEQYKKNKKNKNEVPIVEFRKECRAFAEKWIDVHKDQFKRLGVVGDCLLYTSDAADE